MIVKPFKNEPIIDFSNPEIYKQQAKAIEKIEKQFGGTYELMIAGEKIKTKETFVSYNPSKKDQVIGTFYKATKDLADKAVKEAADKFEEWKNVPPKDRVGIIFKAADIIRKR